jgi:hypothetical protein
MDSSGNDIAKSLEGIVRQYGDPIFDEPKKLRGLLSDLCPNFRKEIVVLTNAANAKYPQELRREFNSTPFETLVTRLAKRLHDDTGCSIPLGKWAIETWAYALSLRTAFPPIPQSYEQPALPPRNNNSASSPLNAPSPLKPVVYQPPLKPLAHQPPPLPVNLEQERINYFLKVDELLRMKTPSAAITVLENALIKFPGDVDINMRLAEVRGYVTGNKDAVSNEISKYQREKRLWKALGIVEELQKNNAPVDGLDLLRRELEAQIRKVEPLLAKAQLAIDQSRFDDAVSLCSQMEQLVADDDRVNDIRVMVDNVVNRPSPSLWLMFSVGLLLWLISGVLAAITANGARGLVGDFFEWASGDTQILSNVFSEPATVVLNDKFLVVVTFLFHGLFSAFLLGFLGGILTGRELFKTIPFMCLIAGSGTALLSLALFALYLFSFGMVLESFVLHFIWGAVGGLLIGTVLEAQRNFDNPIVVKATLGGCFGLILFAVFNQLFSDPTLNIVFFVSMFFAASAALFRLISTRSHVVSIFAGSIVSLLLAKGLETFEILWVIPFVPAGLLPLSLLPFQKDDGASSLPNRMKIIPIVKFFALGFIIAVVIWLLSTIDRHWVFKLLLATWGGAWAMISFGVLHKPKDPSQNFNSDGQLGTYSHIQARFGKLIRFLRIPDPHNSLHGGHQLVRRDCFRSSADEGHSAPRGHAENRSLGVFIPGFLVVYEEP